MFSVSDKEEEKLEENFGQEMQVNLLSILVTWLQ